MKTSLGRSQTGPIQHAQEIAQEHSPAGLSAPHSDARFQEGLPPAPARPRRTTQPVAGVSTPERGSGASQFSPGPAVFAPADTPRQLMARAQKIIDRNARLIRTAPSEDAKLSAIARCCQGLKGAHLFDDGNARTRGMLVVNKLLLENDLRPALMEDPNRFDGFSIDELIAEIKQCQATFAHYSAQ
ncbi:hypothetical protein E4A48_02740 [Xanthomonas cerealis pv. cerealis]|uniref:Fido domain-containing protein n=2 Tax=Xanthomonas TaxID=338 RepID=A0A514EIB0_9XANT|nr:hypothetical protein E4A48_02740 [Xanthomonas translucens pv. cerealis]